jgi:hypothetical protein
MVTVVPPLVLPTVGEIAVTRRPVVGCVVDDFAQAPVAATTARSNDAMSERMGCRSDQRQRSIKAESREE